jgi:hypothetical protein
MSRYPAGVDPDGPISSFGVLQASRCAGGVWQAEQNDNATVWGGSVCGSSYNPFNDGKFLRGDDGTTILRGSGSCCGWDATFTTHSGATNMAVYCCGD